MSDDSTGGSSADRPAVPQVPGQPPQAPQSSDHEPLQPYLYHAEPAAAEGEDVVWTADPDHHLGHPEPYAPREQVVEGPLPVCDYTADGEVACEEPAQERRWSGASIVAAASVGAVVGGLMTAAALVWALGYLPGSRPVGAVRPQADVPVRPTLTIAPGSKMAEVSEAVAARVVPSVVNVTVEDASVDPFSGQQFRQTAGNGSGVIIRQDGYILTNNHVIDGADRIIVTVGVEDKEATVVGVDPASDLAVLKIDGTGYPAIDFGASGDLKVGQYVMAVGSPFGLEKTVTVGIVSALNRSELMRGNNSITTYVNLIQTDAAINPGNSGGALVDAEGRLVGINTLIQSPAGAVGTPQSAGIGFAIPVDFAADIATQLIENGKAVHPYMGVSTDTVDELAAAEFGLPVTSGALIKFVQPQSPAEKGGLQRGDVIVRIAEREIASTEDVFAAIREKRIGSTIEVEVVRGDTRRTFSVMLGSDADRR